MILLKEPEPRMKTTRTHRKSTVRERVTQIVAQVLQIPHVTLGDGTVIKFTGNVVAMMVPHEQD